MDMTDFATRVRTAVEAELGAGHSVDVREVRKNNGVVLHGLTIGAEGQSTAPTIYLEPFLEGYELGEPFEGIIRTILDTYVAHAPAGQMDVSFFRSFDRVKDRICFRLIGQEKNEELLRDIPHIRYLDLAVCFYYPCQDDGIGSGSILIHNPHMEMWGTNAAELYDLAERNTPRIFPWECKSITEILSGIMDTGNEEDVEDMVPMKVLTNTKRLYGDACILYPGVLETLAEREGHSLYILPSSLHEILLLPDAGLCADGLREMVAAVNNTQLAPEDVLSDSVYYYDREKRQVRVA